MAVKTSQREDTKERSSKRRKLSPPTEQQDLSKTKKSKSTKVKRSVPVADSTMNSVQDSKDLPPPAPVQVKGLDSSEPAIRRKQLTSIIEALSARHPSQYLDSAECLAIWRGFFVAAYMHDSKNAISVQKMLQQLASTFAVIYNKDEANESDELKWLDSYHVAFHQTLAREWAGIDSHRMNKYLLLVRFVLRELFKICFSPLAEKDDKESAMSTKGHDAALRPVKAIVKVMETAGPLNPADRKIPDGLRLHVLDIWSGEVFGTLKTLELIEYEKVDRVMLNQILDVLKAPLLTISKGDSGAQKHVRQRAKDTTKDFEDELIGLQEK